MAVAIERGTPLADVLRAQAADVRALGKRQLLESGGRKEIAMMVPVVFIVLADHHSFRPLPGFARDHLGGPMMFPRHTRPPPSSGLRLNPPPIERSASRGRSPQEAPMNTKIAHSRNWLTTMTLTSAARLTARPTGRHRAKTATAATFLAG